MDLGHETSDYSNVCGENTDHETLDNKDTTCKYMSHDDIEGEETDHKATGGEEIESIDVEGNTGCSSTQPSLEQSAASKAMASQNTAHAALFTAELICDIISRLPLKSMVATTGVCRFWRNAAASDLIIQKAMFLAPEGIRKVVMNKSEIPYLKLHQRVDIPPRACVVGILHPSLHGISGCLNKSTDTFLHTMYKPKSDHPLGTWRQMFLSQPPCKKVVILNSEALNPVLYNESGLRLGQFFDFIDGQKSRHEGKIYGVILNYKKQDASLADHHVIMPASKGAIYYA